MKGVESRASWFFSYKIPSEPELRLKQDIDTAPYLDTHLTLFQLLLLTQLHLGILPLTTETGLYFRIPFGDFVNCARKKRSVILSNNKTVTLRNNFLSSILVKVLL